MCVCVCVCEREIERVREREKPFFKFVTTRQILLRAHPTNFALTVVCALKSVILLDFEWTISMRARIVFLQY